MPKPILLPFPVHTQTTPVEEIKDGGQYPTRFYFTIPTEHMLPSPVYVQDVKGNYIAKAYLMLLSSLFRIVTNMFYADDNYKTKFNNMRRVRVYMEYLVSEDAEIDMDLSFHDCVGIRFHFVIYDDGALTAHNGVASMIQENNPNFQYTKGGVVEPDSDDDDEDDDSTKGKKKKKKKKKPTKKKPMGRRPNSIQDRIRRQKAEYQWENVMNMIQWYDLCNVYLLGKLDEHGNPAQVPRDDYSDNIVSVDGASCVPLDTHPLHPDRIFGFPFSCIDGVHGLQTHESDAFGIPRMVYELPNHMLTNTSAIFKCILPNTPQWFRQDGFDFMNTLHGFASKEFMDSVDLTVKEVCKNDIRDIIEYQDDKLNRIRLEKRTMDNELYNKIQNSAVRCLTNVWKPDASVSAPIQLISAFSNKVGTWTAQEPIQVVSPDLSYFGNMVASDLFFFENELRISTTHLTLYRVLINTLDSYRNKKDLHNNILLLGQGATGKSHILDTIQKLFVPDTVIKVSHATAKAHAVSDDNNDHISLYHEMPPSMLGKDTQKTGAETGDYIIKDMMTSCEVNTEQPRIDNEKGTREKVRIKSDCIGVYAAATNERSDQIPEALSTRMIKIVVNNNARPGFSINEMTSDIQGVKGGVYVDKEKKSQHVLRWRNRQSMLMMVEKMIVTHALEDVNMDVFTDMQKKMTKYMVEKGYIYRALNSRDVNFLKHFTRTLVILNAVDKFANDPNSPGYGKEYSFKTLKSIQPYLFCTEEIAMFSLTINSDQLIPTHHFLCLELILYLCTSRGHMTPDDEGVGARKYCMKDDYYTATKLGDYKTVYRKLRNVQNRSFFTEKLSSENIKVAFNELIHSSYQDSAILVYDGGSGELKINAAFVNEHFEWSEGLKKKGDTVKPREFKMRRDMSALMVEIFGRAYANHHTSKRDNMVLGIQTSSDAPFLVQTFSKRPIPGKRPISKLARSTPDEKIVGTMEINSDYVRQGSVIQYKVDMEQYFFHSYLKKCFHEQVNIQTLYDNGVTSNTQYRSYPDGYLKWLRDFQNVDETKDFEEVKSSPKRVRDNVIEEEESKSPEKKIKI